MTSDEYNTIGIWIQSAGLVVSVAVAGIVFWYTKETRRLRIATDHQLSLAHEQAKNSRAPFVLATLGTINGAGSDFTESPLKTLSRMFAITLRNASEQPAIYLSVIVRLNDSFYLMNSPYDVFGPGSFLPETRHFEGPMDSEKLRKRLTLEYQGFHEDVFLGLLAGSKSTISALYMNGKGEFFATRRDVTHAEDGAIFNWAAQLVYP